MIKNTILVTTVVVLSIAVFSVLFAPKKEFKKDNTVRILNFTGYKNLDTIVNASCQVLRLKNIQIVLIHIVDEEEMYTYYAYVQKRGSYYLIKVHPNITEDLLIESCVHEGYHIRDNELGILQRLNYGMRYYDKVYPWSSSYFDRIYEQKAFEHELDLKLKVKQLIPTVN